jgi:hypothetical protein
MTKKGTCAFCGAYGDINEEHFIAKRFRDLFPVQTTPDYGQRISTYDNDLRRYRIDVDRKPRSPWNMTVRVGEKCCNGSWMAALDTMAAPVLNEALTTPSQASIRECPGRMLSSASPRLARVRCAGRHRNGAPPGGSCATSAWRALAGADGSDVGIQRRITRPRPASANVSRRQLV